MLQYLHPVGSAHHIGGGFTYRIKENLHHFGKDFEHKIGSGGGGGDSGGFFAIIIS
jgi:hypothetical protein